MVGYWNRPDATAETIIDGWLDTGDMMQYDNDGYLWLHHDRHPPPHLGPAADHFWSAVWIIPGDYPSGTFAYKVTAIGTNGHSQTWQPFMMRPSQLTIAASSIEFKK
jgi:hypothetical protein